MFPVLYACLLSLCLLPAPVDGPYREWEGPLSPAEQSLFADAADGQWSEHSLLDAALLASGIDDQACLRRYAAQLAELAGEVRRNGSPQDAPRRTAQSLFELLHRRLLRGSYRLDATDLRLAFDRGEFNCVSASILLNCLAQQCGLAVRGLETPGHAMSRVLLPSGCLDIETTCADWFRWAGRHGVSDRSSATPARELSDVQLVATIYYNRGVELLGQHRYPEALAANAKALRLDPANPVARRNLVAALNNWAVAEARAGRLNSSVDLLRRALRLDPQFPTLAANYSQVQSAIRRRWPDSTTGAPQ